MSGLYELFEMDADLEREGITVNYGSVKLLLARAGGRNKAFKETFQAKARKYRTQIDQETLSDDVADRIMAESYAEAVVLGWWTRKEDEHGDAILKGGEEQWDDYVLNGEGKKVKYTVENCVKFFSDLPDLFADVQRMAGKAANYRSELEEVDEGNLEQS